ncbi:MAG: phosphatase PAP2 family protein [Rikenellaceae bacterium]
MLRVTLFLLLIITLTASLRLNAMEWESVIESNENYLLEKIANEKELSISGASGVNSSNDKRNWYRSDDPYDFTIRDLILPSTFIIAGTMSQYVNGVEDIDLYINDVVQHGQSRLSFDDYLQYSPYLLLWTLDACGVKSRHKFKEQTTTLLVALSIMGAVVNTSKYTIKRVRPNGYTQNSMPSGHTAMAFTGAEFLRKEFCDTSPWIGVAGYAFATTTAFMRIWNNRHYFTDTLVGAGIGILSVRAAYWIAPSLNRVLWGSDLRATKAPLTASLLPFTDGQSYGASLQLTF